MTLRRNQSIGYELGSTLYKGQISFGIGPRTPNLVKSKSFRRLYQKLRHLIANFSIPSAENFDKFPEPGAYKLPSDFEKPNTSYNAGKQFSFGAPRQAYDRVYYKERIPHDRSVPGPGHYDQKGLTIEKNQSKAFTLKGHIAA